MLETSFYSVFLYDIYFHVFNREKIHGFEAWTKTVFCPPPWKIIENKAVLHFTNSALSFAVTRIAEMQLVAATFHFLLFLHFFLAFKSGSLSLCRESQWLVPLHVLSSESLGFLT